MNPDLQGNPGEAPRKSTPYLRICRAVAAGGWLILALGSSAAAAGHPFYDQLLREGSSALSRQDYEEAQELLRLANFGYLNEPQVLAGGLVRLAIAEAEGGRGDSFQKTFSRILEIEERFGAYSKASLEDGLVERFEGILAVRVPQETLRSLPAFRPVARRLELTRIRSMAKHEIRPALRGLLAEDPADAEVALMLAEAELQAGDGDAAARVLEALLQRQPGQPEAGCLLGRADALKGRCKPAAQRLEACGDSPSDETLATALLECYAALGQWNEADAFLRRLDASVASERSVSRLGKRVQRGLRQTRKVQSTANPASALEPDPPAQDDERARLAEPELESRDAGPLEDESQDGKPQGGEPSLADPPDAVPPPESPGEGTVPEVLPPARAEASLLPEEARQQLEEARRQLAKARLAPELERALELAKQVADRYPGSSEAQHLVAEIAYRASRWEEASQYFRRGGDPGDERPNLLFFMAVSFYEAGDLAGARSALKRCLPQLQKTTFVQEYAKKVLN